MSSAKGSDIDPTISIIHEFEHLAIQNEWEENTTEYKDQRARLVAKEFEAHFGSNISSLRCWQLLCSAVGTEPEHIPSSITQCKKLLKDVKVNIFDLIDATRSGTAARTFNSTGQLASYSKKNGKIFPRAAAKQNRLLKFMLRHLLN